MGEAVPSITEETSILWLMAADNNTHLHGGLELLTLGTSVSLHFDTYLKIQIFGELWIPVTFSLSSELWIFWDRLLWFYLCLLNGVLICCIRFFFTFWLGSTSSGLSKWESIHASILVVKISHGAWGFGPYQSPNLLCMLSVSNHVNQAFLP